MKKGFAVLLWTAILFVSCASKTTAGQTTEATAETTAPQPEHKGTWFRELTLQQAIETAQREGKLVFIDCYTKTCAPCKMMLDRVFPLEVCGEYLNNAFVSIMLDMEEGEGVAVAERYNIDIYPTYLILSSDGTRLGEVIGADRDAVRFIGKIKDAVTGVKSFGGN